MNIGEKLLELRKLRGLSQEEVADKINVTRQTISKWETNQSTPDLDKIIPLCKLFGIKIEYLLGDEKVKITDNFLDENKMKKKAFGIGLGIFIYFLAVISIMITIPYLMFSPIIGCSIFLFFCGLATFIIVYSCIVYTNNEKKLKEEKSLIKQINSIISCIMLIIYLIISILTNAWHITWIIWIIYALISEIVKLIFKLGGKENEK